MKGKVSSLVKSVRFNKVITTVPRNDRILRFTWQRVFAVDNHAKQVTKWGIVVTGGGYDPTCFHDQPMGDLQKSLY